MSVHLLWCAGSELERAPGTGSPAPGLFGPLLRTAVRCNNARLKREGERCPAATSSALSLEVRSGIPAATAMRQPQSWGEA